LTFNLAAFSTHARNTLEAPPTAAYVKKEGRIIKTINLMVAYIHNILIQKEVPIQPSSVCSPQEGCNEKR